MSLLRTIEERIAHVVEGAFGRVFRSNVQPVELARRLVKEMDEHQHPTVRKVYVPNVYEVFLSPQDHEQFEGYEAALTAELSEYLAEHARRNGYALISRPRVSMHVEPDLELGSFGISTTMEGAPEGGADSVAAPDAPAVSSTMIYKPAAPDGDAAPPPDYTRVNYVVVGPSGAVTLGDGTTSIGRGRSNDVVLHDSSVSREHAEIVPRDDGYVVRDLGSTNGVLVNGAKVREAPLQAGDTLLLGTIELRVEVQGGDSA